MSDAADAVIDALRSHRWTTAELVRIAHAVAQLGKNTTSILGQYGEELVAEAYGGVIQSFDQKAYDVRTPEHGDLQVKTYSVGKQPGSIRSFTHDVVTLAVDPATSAVVRAKLYHAEDLYTAFKARYETVYAEKRWGWGGMRDDRFDRGWTIPSGVPFEDVTDRFRRADR
jgi:hypothetical protein